jgi:UDP-N-acetyl-D-glucosamine dehydrogenase
VSQNLVVVGQGYVGLPMALRAAERGFSVVGLDTNAGVVEQLNAGISHIDDVTDEEVLAGLEAGFRASTDAADIGQADVVVVCVPTPLGADGGPDLSAVQQAARAIGDHVRRGSLVILESTTYPGTTEEIFAPLVLGAGFEAGTDVNIAFSPERIDPGNKVFGVANTPKVVGGLTPACTRAARDFYAQFIDTVVEAKGAKEAEMAKLLENTFRHVNIALVNEMVRFSHELEIDLWDAIDCAATKPFGYMAFRPGPGVGGHCIPVDPSYLSHRVKAELGYAFRMVELAEEINTAAPLYVAQRTWQALNERRIALNGAKVLLLGVTYKADISDRRESPADPLAKQLVEWGAEVSYHDPFVAEWRVQGVDGVVLTSAADPLEAAAGSDIVILLQAHAAYDLAKLAEVSTLVLDTRGRVAPGSHVHRL